MKSIKILKNEISIIKDAYVGFENTAINGEYILCAYTYNDTDIIIYNNNSKQYYKVLFKGENENIEANRFFNEEENIQNKKTKAKESDHYISYYEQIGSDEVGAGDFFFPLIVVATYLDEVSINLIEKYNIKDSKKMGDAKIKEIIPLILNQIKASKLTLENDKYNEITFRGENMVSIKSKMHNSALRNLHIFYPHAKVYVDEFVNAKKYYEYNRYADYIVDNITFKQKGETYFPSVALSSCIARYYLLKYKEQLDNKYKLDFPFGAGKRVDEFINIFVNKYGIEELRKIVKMNFKNYERYISSKETEKDENEILA